MPRRITRTEALKVLMEEACKSVGGTGVGIREALTEARRERVVRAVRRLYREAYGFEVDSGWFLQFGIYSTREATDG